MKAATRAVVTDSDSGVHAPITIRHESDVTDSNSPVDATITIRHESDESDEADRWDWHRARQERAVVCDQCDRALTPDEPVWQPCLESRAHLAAPIPLCGLCGIEARPGRTEVLCDLSADGVAGASAASRAADPLLAALQPDLLQPPEPSASSRGAAADVRRLRPAVHAAARGCHDVLTAVSPAGLSTTDEIENGSGNEIARSRFRFGAEIETETETAPDRNRIGIGNGSGSEMDSETEIENQPEMLSPSPPRPHWRAPL